MRIRAPQLAAVVAVVLAGGFAYSRLRPPRLPLHPKLKTGRADPVLMKRLASANTGFGFRLFSELASEDAGANVFFSPHSVASALAMTWNGAAGETKEAMAKTLGLDGMPVAEVDRAHAQLATGLLRPDKDMRLNIANSLWGAQRHSFRPDFLQNNRDYFGAEVATLDFQRPEAAARRINGWVSRQTEGKIDKLVRAGSLTPDTVLMLVNAVYFEGKWQHPYEPKSTNDRPFTLTDGTKVSTPIMHASEPEEYGYLRGEGFQAARLPYRSTAGKRLALYVFLPDRADGLAAWLKTLTPERWDAWLGKMQPRKGWVDLPKFKMEYEAELCRPLSAMGMAVAFQPGRADFSRMTEGSVYIKRVDHKAVLEVDEAGTVAAAATSVGVATASAPDHSQVFTMVVDHPFFLAIRDDDTGEVLFMGAVWRPTPGSPY